MSGQVSLSVNEVPIKLDFFVSGYIEKVIGGILASLRDTGEIDRLVLSIDNEGQVAINLNGADVPLKHFPIEIIRSTVLGMVSTLKGVDQASGVNTLELSIER
ncbi:MAG: hypothetical protein A2144_12655 [Chloroflexi bacterium RBG_16_50_9]|nr:MAG: hypothetical protein A2144_12655 [Chloroflexi bacterium RBG_16_50_9]